jgi:hypothetical protein
MADRTLAQLYEDALKALQDTRQEFNSKLVTIDQLERELKATKSQLQTTATDLELTKQQFQTTATEFGATKSQLLTFDTTLTKALADIQFIRQGFLAHGTEIVREVHPLALASNDEFIDVDGQWTGLTRTVYGIYDHTVTLPSTQRRYKLVIRQANNGQEPRGDISKYRLFYPWVSNADNIEYSGNRNWGSLDEGGWDTITLDHVVNPFNTDKGGNSYWRLEGFTSNCINRVFNVTLMIVDVIA